MGPFDWRIHEILEGRRRVICINRLPFTYTPDTSRVPAIMSFHFEHDGQRQGIKNERDFEDHGSQWKCLCSQLHVHAICYNSDYMLLHHNYDHLLRERSDRFGQWNASICSNLALELWFHWFISDPTKLFLKLKVGSNGWASHSLFTNEYSLFFFTRTNSERTAKHLGPVSIHAAFIPIRSYRLWTLRT